MSSSKRDIIICSTSLAEYDRRIQRISKTLSKAYNIQWLSRGEIQVDWLMHKRVRGLFTKGFRFYAFFNLRLFFSLLFVKCDIICSVDLDTVLPCFLVSKIRGKLLVFDAHEYFVEVPELEGRRFVKRFWETIEKLCLPRIKNNYTVGPELSKIFAERLNVKYEVIRNVPHQQKENIDRHNDGKTIVYLGMVNEGRGVELAITALVELKDKRLKIIGSGDLEDKMKALAKKLNVENRIQFMGYIQPDEIEKELADCWIAINMLQPISKSYYYSLANKFFDYIQSGIPTINMSFPEYQSIFAECQTGYLAKEYSVECLVKGVGVLENEKYYARCILEINSVKGKYCWGQETIKLLDFYSNLS